MKRLLKGIQHVIDVFFYNYYLYYTSPKWGGAQSISMVIYAMGMTFAIPVVFSSMSLTFSLGYGIYWWVHLLLAVPIVIFTFKYFRKNDRCQKIIDSKPMFFDNQKLSAVLTVLFVLFILIFFFIALPILGGRN